jgi:hypothetical protein
MIARAKKSRQKTTQTTPLRIMLWALLISVICGAIELGEPLEDLYRGARNTIRARPAMARS